MTRTTILAEHRDILLCVIVAAAAAVAAVAAATVAAVTTNNITTRSVHTKHYAHLSTCTVGDQRMFLCTVPHIFDLLLELAGVQCAHHYRVFALVEEVLDACN